jgi:hypothetical protein
MAHGDDCDWKPPGLHLALPPPTQDCVMRRAIWGAAGERSVRGSATAVGGLLEVRIQWRAENSNFNFKLTDICRQARPGFSFQVTWPSHACSCARPSGRHRQSSTKLQDLGSARQGTVEPEPWREPSSHPRSWAQMRGDLHLPAWTQATNQRLVHGVVAAAAVPTRPSYQSPCPLCSLGMPYKAP